MAGPKVHGADLRKPVLGKEYIGSFPENPEEGQLCYKDNNLYIYTDDGQTTEWKNLTGNTVNYVEKNSNYTAVKDDYIITDSSVVSFNITLPANPSMGDTVIVLDGSSSCATNNVSILRNGSNINGTADDVTSDVDDTEITFVYYNSTQGWKLLIRRP